MDANKVCIGYKRKCSVLRTTPELMRVGMCCCQLGLYWLPTHTQLMYPVYPVDMFFFSFLCCGAAIVLTAPATDAVSNSTQLNKKLLYDGV